MERRGEGERGRGREGGGETGTVIWYSMFAYHQKRKLFSVVSRDIAIPVLFYQTCELSTFLPPMGVYTASLAKYYPIENYQKVCMYVCIYMYRDQSIPSLDAIVNGNGRQQYEEMERLVAQQIEMESAKTGSDPTHTHPHHHIPHLSQEPPHRSAYISQSKCVPPGGVPPGGVPPGGGTYLMEGGPNGGNWRRDLMGGGGGTGGGT